MMAVLLYLDRICVGIAAEYIRADLRVSQADMAAFLSVFFWSYALGQVPSGWLSDRFGARIMLAIYIATWSIFTALLGAVNGLFLLLVMRLGIGLGQAGAYPTSGGMISRWVPLKSRAMASGVVAVGGRVGAFLAPLLTAFVMMLFTLGQPPEFQPREMLDPLRVSTLLVPAKPADTSSGSAARRFVFDSLSSDTQAAIEQAAATVHQADQEVASLKSRLELSPASSPELHDELAAAEQRRAELSMSPAEQSRLLQELNQLLERPDLYVPERLEDVKLENEAGRLIKKSESGLLNVGQRARLNRFALEAVLPEGVAKLYGRGWRPTMYVYGGIGLFVMAIFFLVVRNRPEEHPWCNREEVALIEAGRITPSGTAQTASFPLGLILRNASMWLNCFMQIGTNIGWLFVVVSFPRYLAQVHQVPLSRQGWLNAVILFVGGVGMLFGGWTTDSLTRRLGLRWGRGLPMVVTRFTAAAGFGACVLFGTVWAATPLNSALAFTVALSLVTFSTDLGNPAVWAFCQDVGGRNVGSVLGWGNMWGNLGAAAAPLIYNFILGENPGVGEWNRMFAACCVAFILSGLCALGVDCTKPLVPVEPPTPAS